MQKQLFVSTVLATFLMTGCAQKKVETINPNAANNGMNGTGMDSGAAATNVDPFGSNVGGTNNYDENAMYGDNSGIQNIYFDVDRYAITPDMLPTIANNANVIQGHNVKIEGHCDATGTDEYNFALGLRRAKAAKDALVTKGIAPDSVTVVSLGESAPECTSDFSSDCYAKNRRVEFKVQ